MVIYYIAAGDYGKLSMQLFTIECSQELIMCRGEYLTLYSLVTNDYAEVEPLPFCVT